MESSDALRRVQFREPELGCLVFLVWLTAGTRGRVNPRLACRYEVAGRSVFRRKSFGTGRLRHYLSCADTGSKRAVAIKEFFPQVQGCSRNGTAVRPGGMITQAEYLEEKSKFLAEGQRLAQFQHPHIVKVFSLFEENNTAYMVMELLKGKTLLRIIEGHGPLEQTEALTYITQIAEALDVIHSAKLLHRDIKPENIIITEARRAVLLDFGSAREFAAGKTRRMTTTLTPGYAPLEQYGQRARFGVPSDIYSLAATLYHLLTGEIPIQATDRVSGVELPAPHRAQSQG